MAALDSLPLRQLGSHSVLGSSLPFHVSRKCSGAVAGPWQVRKVVCSTWALSGPALRGEAQEGIEAAAVPPLQSP